MFIGAKGCFYVFVPEIQFCVYMGQRVFLRFYCWYSMKTRYVVLRTPEYFVARCLFRFMRSCFVLLEIHSLFQSPLWKTSSGGSCFFSIKNSNLRDIQIVFIAANMIFRVSSSKKKLYDPFLWTGFNCLKSTEPLQGGCLRFITQFREIPGTHLIKLGRMKGWLNLGATRWLSTQGHWIGDPAP